MKPLTKLQKAARGQPCTLRVPGYCNRDDSTTVLCHAPYPGRFGSRKDDWWAAIGCSSCHAHLDQYEQPFVEIMWMPAIHETQAYFVKQGLVVIS